MIWVKNNQQTHLSPFFSKAILLIFISEMAFLFMVIYRGKFELMQECQALNKMSIRFVYCCNKIQ